MHVRLYLSVLIIDHKLRSLLSTLNENFFLNAYKPFLSYFWYSVAHLYKLSKHILFLSISTLYAIKVNVY